MNTLIQNYPIFTFIGQILIIDMNMKHPEEIRVVEGSLPPGDF